MECIGNMSNKELWSGRRPSEMSKLKVADFSEDGEIIPEDLVGLILDLEDDRALKFDRHQVMPFEENPHCFKKHYSTLLITPVRPTRTQAIAEKYNPKELIEKAFSNNSSVYKGYGWRGARENNTRWLQLLHAIHGAELFALVPDKIEVKKYAQKLHVKVPSRSKGDVKEYSFPIAGIPFADFGVKAHAEWLELRAWTLSGLQEWYGVGGGQRVIDDLIFPPQMIATYHTALVNFSETENEILYNPFIVPTQLTVDFSNNLRNRIFRHYVTESGKKKENLNGSQMEFLLWHLTLEKGFDKTWIADNSKTAIEQAGQYLIQRKS